ncbi:type II toxin-antitoxin system Phd/YefM family antitoxin [Jatrophihabitans sp.]|uniref:type II toxin-antitoxin system Phd/YefM family antitoxin n=1 Tax=Jatrophihabitans sp. TaxID=1932789 RepID=UPI0038CDC57A
MFSGRTSPRPCRPVVQTGALGPPSATQSLYSAAEARTITKHGRPVARLVPVSPRSASPESTIAALRTARAGVHPVRTRSAT